MSAAKSILPTPHIVTSMRLVGFFLVFLACACKAKHSISTTKEYKLIDYGEIRNTSIKYSCWSGILSRGLKDNLVFCAQATASDVPRPLTGPTVAFRARQFYDQIRAYIKSENDAVKRRQKEELVRKLQVATSDINGQEILLNQAKKDLADFHHFLQNATGSEAELYQTTIAKLDSRIKTYEATIAELKTKTPASNPETPQSDPAKDTLQDQVDVLERIVDARGTISSDDLGANFEKINMAILNTIKLGAPVELLWHWISNNEISKAEQFLNIPRTSDLSGAYLLVTKIKHNYQISADKDWALEVSSGSEEVKTVKSNTGPLKPDEIRGLNILVPLGKFDFCPLNLKVVLKACEGMMSWRCAQKIGALDLEDIRPYSYKIGPFNFLHGVRRRANIDQPLGALVRSCVDRFPSAEISS